MKPFILVQYGMAAMFAANLEEKSETSIFAAKFLRQTIHSTTDFIELRNRLMHEFDDRDITYMCNFATKLVNILHPASAIAQPLPVTASTEPIKEITESLVQNNSSIDSRQTQDHCIQYIRSYHGIVRNLKGPNLNPPSIDGTTYSSGKKPNYEEWNQYIQQMPTEFQKDVFTAMLNAATASLQLSKLRTLENFEEFKGNSPTPVATAEFSPPKEPKSPTQQQDASATNSESDKSNPWRCDW